jgi:pyruvate dehydrogenase E1 component
MAPEAMLAVRRMGEGSPNVALLAVTSPDRLHAGWTEAQRARREGRATSPSHIETLLGQLPAGAGLVTVLDGHPLTLSWLGGVRRHRIAALGVERFGQSADLPDLYRLCGIDADAIVAAARDL